MVFSRSEMNMRYNAKHKSKICENAIAKYRENKERISARRKEIYAEKKDSDFLIAWLSKESNKNPRYIE